MSNYNDMTVTIKLKSVELQKLCEIYNEVKAEKTGHDEVVLKSDDKEFIAQLLNRFIRSGKQKAEKLEAIGTEFRNSINFGLYK